MLAAPAGELHVVALRMIANLLREAGYDVVMLGADVPAPALAASASRHEPDVICLSATMPGGGDQALISIHEVQQQWAAAGFVSAATASGRACARGRGSRSAGASPRWSRPSTRWSSAPT